LVFGQDQGALGGVGIASSLVTKIVSGGQTGADRGGLDAAIDLGIAHGGWCPRGRLAEDGEIPARYQLEETRTANYPERTEKNVIDSDGTVLITRGKPTGGTGYTGELAGKWKRPLLVIDLDRDDVGTAAAMLRAWLADNDIAVVNIAGPRGSGCAGIGADVRAVVVTALS
jgi:hypothetical protein